MAQGPDWKRFLETGMQFTEMRRSQARQIASDLVEQGQLARDQVSATVDELVAMSKRRTDELRVMVRHEVQRQLGALGLATKDDLARLERKVNAATKKPTATKKTATKAAKTTAAKKPTAKKAG